ncbi:MAG: hypothetical protein MI724_01090 [Spirochaetales bacterium]|nr:hypothetical protein [Spirochaetales bacterium]
MKRLERTLILAVLMVPVAILAMSLARLGPTEPLPLRNYREQAEAGTPRFPVVERAAQTARETLGDEEMVRFLTAHVQRFPLDPNNGYYLTIVGDMYRGSGANTVARQYYRRSLLAFSDVRVRSISTHRVTINRLLEIVEDPAERLDYLYHLRDRFDDEIDRGVVAYYLAKAYEEAGLWEEAYANYRRFLAYPASDIPGEPDVRETIARRVVFYDSPKNWTRRDLGELVTLIKNALWAQNPNALLRHRARANFFTMSWQQEQGDANSEIPTFDIAAFLRRSRVRFAQELDLSSNASEAYLETWGWSHRIPTWYLYFRRVDFPANPEIHGSWEWAGILFGEAL